MGDGHPEERAMGYAPLRRLVRDHSSEEDQKEPRDSELDWILDSLQPATYLRSRERSTGLVKGFLDNGPNILIYRSLASIPDRDAWRQKVVSMRSYRLPVVVLQMMIRRDILRTGEGRNLLDLLPKGEQRRILIDLVSSNGYSRQDIRNMIHVIEAETDQKRCERFLQLKGHKPIWLLHFVMRPSADIRNIGVLRDLISYCETVYNGRRDWEKTEIVATQSNPRPTMAMLNMSPKIFGHTIKYLAIQSMTLDGRCLVKVGDLAAQYIRNIGEWEQHPDKTFHDQCLLFNTALEALTPAQKPLPPTWHRPMAYYWEAQKNLLSMSASLDKQLLVTKAGFRAVREVLAGLDKSATEIHNSRRHARTWPPYLEIGDGIDERTDPEDNWSRSVSAGALQQEAGFVLDSRDQTLDILQGRAPDGTPTIQQRIIRQPNPNMGAWEASIRATRNREEAWVRFSDPPEPGTLPGVHEYGAMFAKLCQRDAEPEMMLRPGDRAFNFPVKQDPNLSEFAKSRMQPPSVSELYLEMRKAGVRPSGGCLDVLVAHAESMAMASTYLRDSDERAFPLLMFGRGGPTARVLRKVRPHLVAAYVKLLCNIETKPGRYLLRAVRLCDKRFGDKRFEDDSTRVWAPYAWGLVLKGFSAKTVGAGRVGRTLTEQLRVYHLVADKIEGSCLLRLPTLVQFSKCIRKAAGRALSEHVRELEYRATSEDSPLRFLYDLDSRHELFKQMDAFAGGEKPHFDARHKPWVYFLSLGSCRLKEMVRTVKTREAEVQKLFDVHEMESLEQMAAREDPVRAGDAHELMAAWAFLGEYEEMASLLEWLVREWDSAELVEQLQVYEQIPGYADFSETLCLFRKFAEPMLSEERVGGIREMMEKAQVVWIWPDDEMVGAFCESQDKSYRLLEHVLEWTRYRQARNRGEDPETLLRPKKWVDLGSKEPSHAYARGEIGMWDMGAI